MEISEKKLAIGIATLLGLAIIFAWISGSYSVETGEELSFEVYLITIVAFVAGAFVAILFQSSRGKAELERVLKVLPGDERTVIKILLENNGKIEQNYLVVLSGFNKVKVSRIVAKLEERGVIDKKFLGNTNYLILKV